MCLCLYELRETSAFLSITATVPLPELERFCLYVLFMCRHGLLRASLRVRACVWVYSGILTCILRVCPAATMGVGVGDCLVFVSYLLLKFFGEIHEHRLEGIFEFFLKLLPVLLKFLFQLLSVMLHIVFELLPILLQLALKLMQFLS